MWLRIRLQRGRPCGDRKSTRLNSSHDQISYAVFCLKKKKNIQHTPRFKGINGSAFAVSVGDVRLWVVIQSFLAFFFNDTATTEIYTLSLHDALPISRPALWELHELTRMVPTMLEGTRNPAPPPEEL